MSLCTNLNIKSLQCYATAIIITAFLYTIFDLIFCVISRGNNECNSWAVVYNLHHYLGCCLHRLHLFRGSLRCGIYWYHPAYLHLFQPGEKSRKRRVGEICRNVIKQWSAKYSQWVFQYMNCPQFYYNCCFFSVSVALYSLFDTLSCCYWHLTNSPCQPIKWQLMARRAGAGWCRKMGRWAAVIGQISKLIFLSHSKLYHWTHATT